MSNVNISKKDKELYHAFSQLDKQFEERRSIVGLESTLVHLQRLRVSQMNGCKFCIKLHTDEVLQDGIDGNKLTELENWADSEKFSNREKLALVVAESTTLLGDDAMDKDRSERLRRAFSEDEISLLVWNCILINSWNRIAIQSGY